MIENFFKTHFEILPKAIAVALSGGADSLALTIMLDEFCQKNKISLVALTVDHKMRENSSHEAVLVQKMLEKMAIKHEILTVDRVPEKNIEANLRNKRYELIAQFCHKHQIEDVFVGHTKNDVAENFLIRVFRGSQIHGLSRIASSLNLGANVKIHRPLLDAYKEDLIAFLQEKNIAWFEDETNQDEKFLRNKIRKFLNSFEDKKLIFSRIDLLTQDLSETRDLLDEIAEEKRQEIVIFDEENEIFVIDFEKYFESKIKIRQKILGDLIMEISELEYRPRRQGIEALESDLKAMKKGQKREFCGLEFKILSNEDLNKNVGFVEIDKAKKYFLIKKKT